MMRIEKAAVLGAGTMGAQIAAHLANAGVPTVLLDIAPRELTAEETSKGLTLESKEVRNRIARAGFEAARKAKPAAFFTPDTAALVSIGNFEDDLVKLKDCDLIIEAVVENLEIKRKLYERVDEQRKPGSIVASNTSGIPSRLLAEGRSEDFRAHFAGVHFFNPPRYLHLVEVIRTEWTKPEVSCFLFGFLDQRLGKGVVAAKDRGVHDAVVVQHLVERVTPTPALAGRLLDAARHGAQVERALVVPVQLAVAIDLRMAAEDVREQRRMTAHVTDQKNVAA